jgi:hypothetical protein
MKKKDPEVVEMIKKHKTEKELQIFEELYGKIRLTINKNAVGTDLEPHIGKKVWYVKTEMVDDTKIVYFTFDINDWDWEKWFQRWDKLLKAEKRCFNFPPIYELMLKYKNRSKIDLMTTVESLLKENKALKIKVYQQGNIINNLSKKTLLSLDWIENHYTSISDGVKKEFGKIRNIIFKNYKKQ